MKKTKIWLGVGAFFVTGAGAGSVHADRLSLPPAGATDTALARTQFLLAETRGHGEGGEGERGAKRAKNLKAKPAGGGEGEGGEKGAKAELPPDLDFSLKIALIRGHLLVGAELVQEKQWNAAFPHFRHPTEELYADIRNRLRDYKVPPFEAALKVLSNAVKAKKEDDYAKALKPVLDALDVADAGLQSKQADWATFILESAIEVFKTSAGEYEEAIERGRIVKPVEYQDARGFIWQGERMIESVAPALEKKDADALARVRAAIAELKKAFPSAMPPKTLVKDYGALLSDVSRIELAAGKLM